MEPYEPNNDSPQDGSVTQDDRNMAVLCHVLGLFTSILGPLVLWMVMKEKSPFVDFHGKQALNFNITLVICYMVSAVLFYFCIGIFTFLATMILQIIFTIIPAMKAYNGQRYVIPIAIPFLR